MDGAALSIRSVPEHRTSSSVSGALVRHKRAVPKVAACDWPVDRAIVMRELLPSNRMNASDLVRLFLTHLLGLAVLTGGALMTVWMSGVVKNTFPELGSY